MPAVKQKLTSKAPGKLIISGEHSVLYGAPAIAVAVQKYATCTITRYEAARFILLKLLDLKYTKKLTLDTLKTFQKEISKTYKEFLDGKVSIREVIQAPFELLQFTLATFLHQSMAHNLEGAKISTESSIPIGCGMGSSAATITSALHAMYSFCGINPRKSEIKNQGQFSENLQHGKSSGLDVYLSTYGGSVRFQNGKSKKIALPELDLYVVNTGSPITTTGECTTFTKKFFQSDELLKHFDKVTSDIEKTMLSNDMFGFIESVKENHALLNQIRIVPDEVNELISAFEQSGGAGKICGAGAVSGSKGGMVLAVGEQVPYISKRYGYEANKLNFDNNGVCLAN